MLSTSDSAAQDASPRLFRKYMYCFSCYKWHVSMWAFMTLMGKVDG